MTTLMSYLTGFGLAGGAGTKASVAVLLLGGLHYTPYFELSERWAWIASPPVLAVLAVLVIAEIAVDSSPDLGAYADVVAYLPKFVVGFIAFAAATGDVDQSLLELAGSGLLGGGTAMAVHWLRNQIRRPIRDLEDLHSSIGKAASFSEAGLAATIAGSAVVWPIVSLLLLSFALAGGLGLSVWIDRRRSKCGHCGGEVRHDAVVCPHCGQEIE